MEDRKVCHQKNGGMFNFCTIVSTITVENGIEYLNLSQNICNSNGISSHAKDSSVNLIALPLK
jgi:hypothetical protein